MCKIKASNSVQLFSFRHKRLLYHSSSSVWGPSCQSPKNWSGPTFAVLLPCPPLQWERSSEHGKRAQPAWTHHTIKAGQESHCSEGGSVNPVSAQMPKTFTRLASCACHQMGTRIPHVLHHGARDVPAVGFPTPGGQQKIFP